MYKTGEPKTELTNYHNLREEYKRGTAATKDRNT